ncbi:MAG: antitoxin [Nanoarchaeota archaeon]
MVQAVIKINDRTNRVLNIVKAKFGLKDKSQAINLVVNEYEQSFLEPELRPEYKVKLDGIISGKHFTRGQLEEAL